MGYRFAVQLVLLSQIYPFPSVGVEGVLFVNFSGTGSAPPGVQGWQRAILFILNQPPRQAPKRAIACAVYSEHVGVNRQHGGFNGER